MLAELLPELERGHLPRRPQDDSLATVMPKRTPDDGLIDWTATARQVFNLVRAVTHPYPGAFTFVGGRKVFVWRVDPSAGSGGTAAPGTVDVVDGSVIVVIGWTQLLRDELLGLPRLGCLGFHASLLPRYRGRAPINWALINDEPETGNTLMVLSPGADEGEIVAQRRIPITDADDCATLYERVS